MDTMTPEQQAAHNALTLPLWLEWEEFCRRFAECGFRGGVGGVQAVEYWREKVDAYYGGASRRKWHDGVYNKSDCIVAGDHYVWVGDPLTD